MAEKETKKESTPQAAATGGSGMEPNLAGALSYVLGPITGIIFLVLEPENDFVRFHAMQSILVGVAVIIANFVLGVIPILGWLLGMVLNLVVLIAWLMLMYKAYLGEEWELPVVGEIARQQISK